VRLSKQVRRDCHVVLLLPLVQLGLALVDVVALDLIHVLRHLNRDVASLRRAVSDAVHYCVRVDLVRIVLKLVHHWSERPRTHSFKTLMMLVQLT